MKPILSRNIFLRLAVLCTLTFFPLRNASSQTSALSGRTATTGSSSFTTSSTIPGQITSILQGNNSGQFEFGYGADVYHLSNSGMGDAGDNTWFMLEGICILNGQTFKMNGTTLDRISIISSSPTTLLSRAGEQFSQLSTGGYIWNGDHGATRKYEQSSMGSHNSFNTSSCYLLSEVNDGFGGRTTLEYTTSAGHAIPDRIATENPGVSPGELFETDYVYDATGNLASIDVRRLALTDSYYLHGYDFTVQTVNRRVESVALKLRNGFVHDTLLFLYNGAGNLELISSTLSPWTSISYRDQSITRNQSVNVVDAISIGEPSESYSTSYRYQSPVVDNGIFYGFRKVSTVRPDQSQITEQYLPLLPFSTGSAGYLDAVHHLDNQGNPISSTSMHYVSGGTGNAQTIMDFMGSVAYGQGGTSAKNALAIQYDFTARRVDSITDYGRVTDFDVTSASVSQLGETPGDDKSTAYLYYPQGSYTLRNPIQRITETGPAGEESRTELQYGPNGLPNLVRTWDYESNSWINGTLDYDSFGRVTNINFPGAPPLQYAYSGANLVSVREDPSGLNRLTQYLNFDNYTGISKTIQNWSGSYTVNTIDDRYVTTAASFQYPSGATEEFFYDYSYPTSGAYAFSESYSHNGTSVYAHYDSFGRTISEGFSQELDLLSTGYYDRFSFYYDESDSAPGQMSGQSDGIFTLQDQSSLGAGVPGIDVSSKSYGARSELVSKIAASDDYQPSINISYGQIGSPADPFSIQIDYSNGIRIQKSGGVNTAFITIGTGSEAATTTFSKNPTNNAVTITDALGHSITNTPDANGIINTYETFTEGPKTFEQETNGNYSVQNATGQQIDYEVDALGRFVNATAKEMSTGQILESIDVRYGVSAPGYSANQHQIGEVEGNNDILQYDYDQQGRIITAWQRDLRDGDARYIAFDYTNDNKIAEISYNGEYNVGYLYAGEFLVSVSDIDGIIAQVVRRHPSGAPLEILYRGGSSILATRDIRGHLLSYEVKLASGEVIKKVSNINFEHGQLKSAELDNDLWSPTGISLEYNSRGGISQLSVDSPSGAVYNYEREVDLADRLIRDERALPGGVVGYDGSGNNRHKPSAINFSGVAVDHSYSYDGNKNISSRTVGSETYTYTYDAFERITSATSSQGTVEIRYSGNGQRLTTEVTPSATSLLGQQTSREPALVRNFLGGFFRISETSNGDLHEFPVFFESIMGTVEEVYTHFNFYAPSQLDRFTWLDMYLDSVQNEQESEFYIPVWDGSDRSWNKLFKQVQSTVPGMPNTNNSCKPYPKCKDNSDCKAGEECQAISATPTDSAPCGRCRELKCADRPTARCKNNLDCNAQCPNAAPAGKSHFCNPTSCTCKCDANYCDIHPNLCTACTTYPQLCPLTGVLTQIFSMLHEYHQMATAGSPPLPNGDTLDYYNGPLTAVSFLADPLFIDYLVSQIPPSSSPVPAPTVVTMDTFLGSGIDGDPNRPELNFNPPVYKKTGVTKIGEILFGRSDSWCDKAYAFGLKCIGYLDADHAKEYGTELSKWLLQPVDAQQFKAMTGIDVDTAIDVVARFTGERASGLKIAYEMLGGTDVVPFFVPLAIVLAKEDPNLAADLVLTTLGMIPAWGTGVDLAALGKDVGRGIAGKEGAWTSAGITAVCAIPVLGLGAGAVKLAKIFKNNGPVQRALGLMKNSLRRTPDVPSASMDDVVDIEVLEMSSGQKMDVLPETVVKGATNSWPDSFFANARYTDKVKRQMRSGDNHGFPDLITGLLHANESKGRKYFLKAADGREVQVFSALGYKNGKPVVFEWIKEANGDITHRLLQVDLKRTKDPYWRRYNLGGQ